MKTKHTLGPWKMDNYLMIVGSNGDYICKMDASEGNEWRADAKLIAAAPDLLLSLQGILSGIHMEFEGRVPAGIDAWVSKAVASIKKATGGV